MQLSNKLLIIIVICIQFVSPIKAQDKKWEIGLQLNSILETFPYGISQQDLGEFYYDYTDTKEMSLYYEFLADKYLSNSCMIGLRIGIVNIDISQHYDPRNHGDNGVNSGISLGDLSYTQKRTKIAARFSWDFPKDRIAIRIGFEIPYIHYDDFIEHESGTHYTDSSLSQIGYTYENHSEIPGGFSLGAGAFVGFKYSLVKRLMIGAEFSSSINYFVFEGTESILFQTTPVNPPGTIQEQELRYTFSKKGFEYPTPTFSLNLIYIL